MPQTSKPAKVVSVDYQCDVEGCDGVMRPAGMNMLLSDPPQYPHECTVCKTPMNFPHRYPNFGYVQE